MRVFIDIFDLLDRGRTCCSICGAKNMMACSHDIAPAGEDLMIAAAWDRMAQSNVEPSRIGLVIDTVAGDLDLEDIDDGIA